MENENAAEREIEAFIFIYLFVFKRHPQAIILTVWQQCVSQLLGIDIPAYLYRNDVESVDAERVRERIRFAMHTSCGQNG